MSRSQIEQPRSQEATLGTRGYFRVRWEFSVLAEGRHIFGRRPKPRTALEKSLAPRATGSGPVYLFMHNFRREENLYKEIIQA